MKKKQLLSPLAVYVVHHECYLDGQLVFENLYNKLGGVHVSSSSPCLRIPVYHIIVSNITINNDIQFISSELNKFERIAIIQIVDQGIIDSKAWLNFITEKNRKIQILPIKACNYAEVLSGKLTNSQFVILNNNSILQNWIEFETRVFDFLVKQLNTPTPENKKTKIFISHSKKDSDFIGENCAKQLKEYLRQNTKFDSFFDVNDIMDGDSWKSSINANIKSSLVIILFSNTFSEREWCRKELLFAKKNECPILLVSLINGDVPSLFPYIGNVPCVSYGGEAGWARIINILLYNALHIYYLKAYLKFYIGKHIIKSSPVITPYAPEALTLIKTTARKDVIYPEPHLSFDEMKILNQIKPEVHFYTPSIYQFGNINLKNKKIAISVSSPDSEELAKNHICSKHLEDITIELVRYILIAKGRVIYGGDLRHGGYTEKFEQLSNEYAYSERLSLDEDYYIENYLPWPDSLQVTENTILEYKSRHMKLIPLHSPDVKDEKRKCNFLMRAISLSQMREEMSQVSIARVLVGGKLHGYSGKMPGIMEEFLRAVKRKQPIYLIGGFGGMAQRIASGIMRKEMYNIDFFNSLVYQNPLFEMKCLNRDDILDELNVFRNLSYDILHNGLSVESNQRLFLSTDIVEIVSLLLSGMKAILK